VANLRAQFEPVPRSTNDKALPVVQPGWLIAAWTSGAISSIRYQVDASHCWSELCVAVWASSVRCDGRLAAENAALLTDASMPYWKLMVSHCALAERSSSRAEVTTAPGGTLTPVKRRPA
jgi:hypothetical protein